MTTPTILDPTLGAHSEEQRASSEQQIVIDPTFRDLIPPLNQEERAQLEDSLKTDGCRSPLVAWEGQTILLDGHHRHQICTANKIEFEVRYLSFPDRGAAMDWMILNQLGQRNLAPKDAALLRGKLYHSLKKCVPNKKGANQYKKEVKGQSGPQPTTAQRVAKKTGVSENTVKRDAAFAAAAEQLGDQFDKNDSKTETIRKAKLKRDELQPKPKTRAKKASEPAPGSDTTPTPKEDTDVSQNSEASNVHQVNAPSGEVVIESESVEVCIATGTGTVGIPDGAPLDLKAIQKKLTAMEKKWGKEGSESVGMAQRLFLECATALNIGAAKMPSIPRVRVQFITRELWDALT